MTLYDRVLVRSYLKAYVVVLVSLLSLYIVVDLFTNIDEFTNSRHGLARVLQRIIVYYAYRITHIFDKLCEAIVMLAAMFTVAWMQRSNELAPLLSAGVSTRRVVRPVLLSAFVMLGLSMLNQELVIPRLSDVLLTERDDPATDKAVQVHGAYEPNEIHLSARIAMRKQKMVQDMSCVIPATASQAQNDIYIHAKEAFYKAPGEGPYGSGGWLLTDAQPRDLARSAVFDYLDPGKYFLHTQDVDFDRLTRSRTWFVFASTYQLLTELNRPESTRLASMAVLFHARLTRPLLGFLLVLMGLSVILRDQNRNVFISAGLCLVICAVFFAAGIASKNLGDSEYLSPIMAAWLPVLVFGPLGFVAFDAIQT
ncbi:MAG TPA: LptF/LptG family permease [Gemmataceae bacterium]|nr:LptF/LptG family permease [Gemmataceae bacterium]